MGPQGVRRSPSEREVVETLAEPWYHVAKGVALPPVRLWLSYRFEDLARIPSTGPAIVAVNHISYLDPLTTAQAVIRAGRRPRFLAKDELFRIPLIGRVLRGANQIPVVRGSGDHTPLERAEAALAAGEAVVIYPEGTVTRRHDGMPMEAKTGTVRLALASGVPIWPMASWGSQDVWQKSGRGSLRPGRPLWVKVGEPLDLSHRAVDPNDHDALVALTGELTGAITALVVDLRTRYPVRWTPRSVQPFATEGPG